MLTSNRDSAFSRMRISSILHPTMLFALSNGAGFPQNSDGPLERTGRRPTFSSCQHRTALSAKNESLSPRVVPLFDCNAFRDQLACAKIAKSLHLKLAGSNHLLESRSA
jgi:hypothetical protein